MTFCAQLDSALPTETGKSGYGEWWDLLLVFVRRVQNEWLIVAM